MMKKTKEIYSQPTTTLLVVRVEQNILVLSTQGNTINAATIDAWEDEL